MIRSLAAVFLALSCLLFTGCQSNSVESRIEGDRAAFERWPAEVQEAVEAGRIEPGFTPAQVRMAWGEPDHQSSTLSAEAETEKWIYEKRTPAFSIGIGVGGGSGNIGVGTSVGTTVGGWTKRVGTVVFRDGRVETVEQAGN
ncbi:MAG: hypothetical protein ACLFR7_10655 [Opitutales bacterium]